VAFVYHCFDRIVIHGCLTGLSRPDQMAHFFRQVVGVPVITKEMLNERTASYQTWVEAFARNLGSAKKGSFCWATASRLSDARAAKSAAFRQQWPEFFGPCHYCLHHYYKRGAAFVACVRAREISISRRRACARWGGTMSTQEIFSLARIIADWATAAPSFKFYVYGSRIRGDHRADSDVDICVMVPARPQHEETVWWTNENDRDFLELGP
jgi:Nucleotidyltransferase domain